MNFMPTGLDGAYIIELERKQDERGFFARTFCRDEFAAHGLLSNFVQCNTAFNIRKGTLRGMHYQDVPYEEVKLVRCTRGSIYDVIIDMRKESPTYCGCFGIELSAKNQAMIYVPEGFAHGLQTLEENCEVFYQMGEIYRPEAARGIRWNDPLFDIQWPIADPFLSSKDASYPDFVS